MSVVISVKPERYSVPTISNVLSPIPVKFKVTKEILSFVLT